MVNFHKRSVVRHLNARAHTHTAFLLKGLFIVIYRLIVDMPCLPAGSGCGPILGAVDGGGVHAVRREGRQ